MRIDDRIITDEMHCPHTFERSCNSYSCQEAYKHHFCTPLPLKWKGDNKSCLSSSHLSVCMSVLHKNFNLAHNFQAPKWISTKFGGKVYFNENYNSLGFESDPMKTVTRATVCLLKFSGFGILCCRHSFLMDFYQI